MRKFSILWFIVLILFGSGCEVSRPPDDTVTQTAPSASATLVNSQSEAIIKIRPELFAAKVGDTLTIEILVENVVDLFAADIDLQFDPVVLQAQDADHSKEGIQVQPGDFLSPDFQVINEIDNDAGLAHYAVTQLAPGEPASGSGVIMSITFVAIADGSSELTFTQTDLASKDAQLIVATPIPGQVTVDK